MADEEVQRIAPFSELLLQQRGGALHAEASDALHELVEAIEATGRGGELRIVLKINEPIRRVCARSLCEANVGRIQHIGSDRHTVLRVGKKTAGRELDGRTHDEFPEVAA